MTHTTDDAVHWKGRRDQWIARVEALVEQLEAWASAQGWATARTDRIVNERLLGQYTVPALRIRLPAGEVHILPVGLNVVGASGRVDMEAFPTLNRVKLVGQDDAWQVYTDSNVPLRQPWNAETFVQVANDLLA